MRLKHLLFAAGFGLITATRADRWLRSFARGRGVTLMFHHVRPWRPRRFAPNRLLEITPEYLEVVLTELRRERFDLIPLDVVPERLRADSCRHPFAVLTFDDGYRDNVEHAWPVLKRYSAPWTLFVTTDFADARGRLWWLELEEAIARLDRVCLNCDGDMLDLPSRTAREKQSAFEAVYWRLRAGPEGQLRATIAGLAGQAGIAASGLNAELCLGWDEIQQLAREPDITIGAHTVSHPILAKHDAAVASREIAGSKALLEQRLGQPVRHLAYPIGDATSAGAREFSIAQRAGFVTAVTSRPGHIFADHAAHLHALPRVSINGLFQSEMALRALLSGVPFLAWNRGHRVSVEP